MLDYRARYYDPVLGRFVSADTIVPDPTNSQSLNRYSYVYNNPLIYTDPSGHDPCTAFGPDDPDCKEYEALRHASDEKGWLAYYLGLYYEAHPVPDGYGITWMDIATHIILASEMAYKDGVISYDDYIGISMEAKGLPFQNDPALAFASASYLQVQSQWMYLSTLALPSLFNRSTGYYDLYTFAGEKYPGFRSNNPYNAKHRGRINPKHLVITHMLPET